MIYSLFTKKTKSILIKTLLTVAAFLTSSSAFAVDVNRSELEQAGSTVITFENYTGPHKVIETADAIRGIGRNLGSKVKANPNEASVIEKGAKYSVIHVVDPSEKEKLDADILIIDEKATVDHIKNLRRIIGAYLMEAYGYDEKDASTLATFITVYNAVYRGNIDAFNAKYKAKVTVNLTEEKCGLSTKWTEWAGKSQIVIPLNDVNGGISTVDTTLISDRNVVDNMREDDERGIDERKNMVDIKERESENAAEKARADAKNAAEATKQVETEKQILEQDKAEAKAAETKAIEAENEAKEAKKAAEENPKDSDLLKKSENKEKAAKEARKEAEEAKETVAKQEEKVQQAKESQQNSSKAASENQAFADKKLTEAQSERVAISTDQKEVLENQEKNANAQTVVGLMLSNKSKLLSAMVKVNIKTGEIVKTSPVNVIRGRTIVSTGSSYVAICGENSGNGAVKLCLLDGNTMEIIGESEETISEDSVLVQSGGNFYCVVVDKKDCYLGKFDANLKLVARSEEKISSQSPITATPSGIVATNASGKIVLLKDSDLTKATE